MNEVLMQAVVDLAAFLELSPTEILDPDAAAQQLEQLVSTLRHLSQSDREAFVTFVNRAVAMQHSRVAVLRGLPKALGLELRAVQPAHLRQAASSDARIIAIDWSGSQADARKHIWIAEVHRQSVTMLECGRDRTEVVDWLIAQRARGGLAVVGLDFAFSFPDWFLRSRGWADAPTAWKAMCDGAEAILAACDPPFWGRPGRGNPKHSEPAYRRTETALDAVAGIRPKSVFQIGGAGAVGTGSLRGMQALHRLDAAGFAVWPFSAPADWTILEIYPRILTGAINKSNPASKRAYLARYPALAARHRDAAVQSEDAFDALVSALQMSAHADELANLSIDSLDATTRREGLIWAPRSTAT